jgi:hypothetical protein
MAKQVEKKLLINRTNPDHLRPVFVNDLVLTHSSEAFFITLSQIEAPALMTEDEVQSVNDINAVAVAKIVVTPKFLKLFIDTMVGNYAQYLENIKEEGE